MSIPVSIIILTYNEEANIGRCLDSIVWCDDIVLLDSHSTDGTEKIAREKGSRIYHRRFDDYARQRNHALNNIKYKYPWLLMLDADETVSRELKEEIRLELSSVAEDVTLFRMRRKDFLFGRWIKNSSKYPIWFGRLMRAGRVHVERAINEEYHTDGKVRLLKQHLHHYPFNKGFHAWLEKHNRYSTMEAELKASRGAHRFKWGDFLNNDPTLRRKTLKALLHHLPARPLLIFAGLYLVRLGFLEGRAGFTYCLLTSFYEYLIDLKIKEIQARSKGLPV